MSLRLGLVYLTLVIALISCQTVQAEAAPYSFKGTAIGIIISKSCQISPTCLKYADIIDLDSSDPTYTGKFVMKNGDYSRQATSKQNNYKWLEFSPKFTVLIDPPLKFRDQIPLITIVPSLDEYHLEGQMAVHEYKPLSEAKSTQSIRSFSHTRYVDSTCTNAIITAKDWKKVLPDTIDYLRNGCDPKHTSINTITNDIKNLTKHDLATTNKNKLDKFYAHVLKECTKARNACTSIENRAITTMGDSK